MYRVSLNKHGCKGSLWKPPPPQPEYGHEPEGQTEPWPILSNFKVFLFCLFFTMRL